MILSFDTETRGFEWWNGQTAFLATTAVEDREWAYDLADAKQVEAFHEQLRAAELIVAHNLKFDVHQVRATTGLDILDLGKELHDTDTMARVFWPEGQYGEHGGFGLKNLAKVFVDPNADAAEEAVLDHAKQIGYRTLNKDGAYYDVWRAFPSVMEHYAKQDVRYTWDLFKLLTDEYEACLNCGDGRAELYDLERKVLPILLRAEQHGTPINPERVEPLYKQYKVRERELRGSLEAQLGEQALGGEGSTEALIEGLQKCGVPLYKTTETGQLATNKYALQEFEKDHPIIREFQEYRTVEKFLSTYIEPMRGQHVIHPSLRQIGTWTGRMSCAKPNMQNIPVRAGTEVREPIEAPVGYKLVTCDFEGIEVRVLAYYLGKEGRPYRDLLLSDFDPHAWMASKIWGGHPDEYLKGTPGAGKRALAKNVLFAIIYGAGGKRICDMANLDTGPPLKEGDWEVRKGISEVGRPSYAKGKAMARKVKGSIPGYLKLNRRVKNKIEAHGYVTTLGGRRQAVAADKSYVGMSGLIQGSAADIMKAGAVALDKALASYDCRTLMFVHDEWLGLVREDQAPEVLDVARAALAGCWDLDPPLHVDGKIIDNYGEAK